MTRIASGLLAALVFIGQGAKPGGPKGPPYTEDAYRHNNVGVARLEQYDYTAAVQEFRTALELYSDLSIARLNLAIALLYDGQPEVAEEEIQRALPKLPDVAQARFVAGLIARAANRPDDAAAAFQQVIKIDPSDPGAHLHLGQVRLAQRQFAEAVTHFETALELEPFNATAAYGLAQALTRGGDRARGEPAMARFQALRDNPAATTYSTTYLEQGRYGEAIASTGLEPELVDRAVPSVTFTDATSAMLAAGTTARDASLADIDGDGNLDLLLTREDGVQLLRNAKGRFTPAHVVKAQRARAALAGDYDNDGVRDLAVLTDGAVMLFHGERDGSFRDVTATTLPGVAEAADAAAFVDADHDGDLDLIAGPHLLRNNGNGRFEEIAAQAKVDLRGLLTVVPTDYDNRRDVDLLVVRSGSAPALFSNQRDGTFRDVAGATGLPTESTFTTAATGDLNKDMAPDYFFGRRDAPGTFAMSTAGGRFTRVAAPAETAGALASQLVDYDNDGLLDLLVLTTSGPHLWRWLGGEWADVTSRAFPRSEPAAALATGDVDADGDEDIIVRLASGAVRVLRNDGGSARRSIRVRLAARVSNRDAVGAKVELRAGSLRQRAETFATTPAVAPADLVFGIGPREKADVVRVLWPAGILQAETEVARPVTRIEELDRKPSSCPFLYTWNGSRFEFITDFLGGGELGYWVAPGARNVPDPDEYVRIPGDKLRERNGRYELRITNELEEALFVDRLQLVAVSHPGDVDVYPNEGLRSPERREPFNLFTVRGTHPPLSAVDQNGKDVRDRIETLDRRYADAFARSHIQGYAAAHSITFDTGARPSDPRVLLLLTGWTDYAFSSDNVAAHQAGLSVSVPELQGKGADGRWRTVIPEIGMPVGRPQTIVLDVTAHTRRGVREFRVLTTLRVYWDRILVDTSTPQTVSAERIEAESAVLHRRGFSAEVRPDGREPATYDYERVEPVSPWKMMPGRYTREGDVKPLVATTDDRFAVAAPGDEIAISFPAAALPRLPRDWTRTFLLYADGFSKEMNLSSASPDVLMPLPFHAMKSYPYGTDEAYPDTPAHREYRDAYNTRIIRRSLPPLETAR